MPGAGSTGAASAGGGRVAYVSDYLAYLYLLRVPLIALLLLIALPLVAVPHGAALGPLLRGIFDVSGTSILRTALGFMLISFASLMLGMTIGLTARLVLLNGHERFGVGEIPDERGVELAVRLVPLLAALGVIVGVCFQAWPFADICHVLAGASGIVAAVVVLRWLVPWIHAFVWHDETHPRRAPRALMLPFDAAADAYEWLGRKSPQGYFKPTGEFRPAHVFASHQLVLSLTAYALLWFFKRVVALSDPLVEQQPVVPTLCLLLVLMMLTCWALSAVTFFADRFRIPVLLPVIAYFGVMSAFPQGDYFYPSHEPKRVERRRSPAEVIERHAGEPMVVVAAAGGGIHAAAWTARVLSGLKQALEQSNDPFPRALAMMSGVSGGSVGIMHFADAYSQSEPNLLPAVKALDDYAPILAAEASSLDHIAWGLTYPDLFWSVLTPFKGLSNASLTSDRGYALERALQRTPPLEEATLSTWRGDIDWGRPAMMFSATVVETGDRLIIGSTEPDAPARGRQCFSALYPPRDLNVVTAVRLSATFPGVSPAARILGDGMSSLRPSLTVEQDPDWSHPALHVVDGGYYDNYGVASLVDWLDEGLSQAKARPSRVLVILIRGWTSDALSQVEPGLGTYFQITHPLLTLFQVRGSGQFANSDLAIRYAMRSSTGVPIHVVPFEFQYTAEPDFAPPLSWHLTPHDKAVLRAAWNPRSECVERVKRFFAGTLAPSSNFACRMQGKAGL